MKFLQRYKKTITGTCVTIGILFLIPSIVFFVSNIFFFFGKYEISQKINSTLGEVFPYNQNIILKQADYFYKKGEYQTALLYYLGVECTNPKICFLLGHNLGNTFYKFGEGQVSKDIKINFWLKSLQSYREALDIKWNEKTQKNYDFVREKLEELQQEQEDEDQQPEPEQEDENQDEEESEEQNEDENSDQEEGAQEEENSDTNEDESQNPESDNGEQGQQNSQDNSPQTEEIPTSQNPNFGLGGDEQEGFSPLTPEERNIILQELENLQNQELQNRELNKPGNRNNIFDEFGVGRFFQNRNNQDW